MRLQTLLLIGLVTGACTALPFPHLGGGGGKTTTTQTTSTTEEMNVNGRPVRVAERDDRDHEDDDRPRPSRKGKSKGDLGSTCRKNHECAADACFVGTGDLGYCTKMCDSWSDCPSHWECKRARNAPQRICMQDGE